MERSFGEDVKQLAMKILQHQDPAIGDTHVAHDLGCSTFSTQAPFNVGNSVLGYGIGLASSSAVAPLFGKRVVSVIARWAERRWPEGRPTLGQHVRTTTVTGYLRLWLLARCRRLRPSSYRAHHEHARMERWLDLVDRSATRDLELAREVAQAARLVKGYGQVRRRLEATFDDLLARVSRAADLAVVSDGNFRVARALARRCRELVLAGPDGEVQAPRVAASVVQRLEAGDRAGALAAFGEPA